MSCSIITDYPTFQFVPSEYTGVFTAPPLATVLPKVGVKASVTNALVPDPDTDALGNVATVKFVKVKLSKLILWK